MKELKINNFTSIKALETQIKVETDKVVITGTIKDLKKKKLMQDSHVLGAEVYPEPEIIQAKDFKVREDLDKYIRNLLGDNLTLNRRNRHKITGKKKDLDKLYLGINETIFGVFVEYE